MSLRVRFGCGNLNLNLLTMINKILDELKTQYQIPEKIFNMYEFEMRGNKIFIMTHQVKQFDEIKSVRKGVLFAVIKGGKIELSDNGKQILSTYGWDPSEYYKFYLQVEEKSNKFFL